MNRKEGVESLDLKIKDSLYFNRQELDKLDKRGQYLIAFSHGPDSTYLVLYLINKGFKNLILAHVNYKARPESDSEEEKVKLFGQKHHLKVEILNDVNSFKTTHHQNFQTNARLLRFSFFLKLVQKYQIKVVFVATTFDDVIENFILRGLKKNYYGLFIPIFKTKYQKIVIYRPLLETPKKKILEYLIKHKIDYCIDSSNKNLTYKRNIVRYHIRQKLDEKDKYFIFNNLIIPFIDYYFKNLKEAFLLLKKNTFNQDKLNLNILNYSKQEIAFLAFQIWLKKELQKIILTYYPFSYPSFKELINKVRKSKKSNLVLFDYFERWQIILNLNMIELKKLNPKKIKKNIPNLL
ncbi:tRNA lysidine(34) synthetase TilS [Mycoplasma sp. SG1]|uniref:tRNA lysidine(34) synthetase TilS n=1 Tax=Mycoplasma sp. SG1 TaxID=2810348 RepID=UPI0020246744|nr:tRNA lysidine(34) synthetase TilS [Mycoplasma sp. SG1]URM52816.1 tRNA lysidine(34) synthetase TilS [Mycoplasma sp. SG1]